MYIMYYVYSAEIFLKLLGNFQNQKIKLPLKLISNKFTKEYP